jgi:hypothetical protein
VKKQKSGKHTGYCLHQVEQGLVSVAVTPEGDHWRVSDLTNAKVDQRPSSEMQLALRKATTPVTWLLNDDEASMSHMSVPRLKGKGLLRALAGGLARDKGGTPEDRYFSFHSLDSAIKSDATMSYVLHHSPKPAVDAHLQAAKEWGVDVQRVLPATLALDLFYRQHGPEHGAHAAWNLVFVGEHRQFLSISTSDAQLVLRNLPANLSDSSDQDEYLAQLATEIDRSVFFARQTLGSPEIETVIVCGDPKVAGPLVTKLGETSDIPAIHWTMEDMFQGTNSADRSDSLLALAGAVLAANKCELNLLPGRSSFHFSRSMRRRVAVASATCAAAVVPVLLVGGLLTAKTQATYLADARARLAKVLPKAERAEEAYATQRLLLSREDKIKRFAQTRPDFESVLLRLADITPHEIVFTDLRVREQASGAFSVKIVGESRAFSGEDAQAAFLQFLSVLDSADFLTRIGEPQMMQLKPGRRVDGENVLSKTTVFHLNLQWRGPQANEDS